MSEEADDGWEPGRWFRILQADGTLWMETSNSSEVIRAWRARPTNSGWVLQRLWVLEKSRWQAFAPEDIETAGKQP